METRKLKVDKSVDNLRNCPQIKEAAQLLLNGEVVSFPTETVYGLGGNIYNNEAISKIFTAKGRPADNPLIIHISNLNQLETIVEQVTHNAKKLIEKFWPGPLTIILQKKSTSISSIVTANLSTVAVRMPDHRVALAIIEEANIPIAAPSANQSGKPSPTTAEHVYNDLNGKISAIVDGGETRVGIESTVIDCTVNPPIILRPGSITKEQLEEVIGTVQFDLALLNEKEQPKSPGMKYRHYAPEAPVFIVEGSEQFFQAKIDEQRKLGKKVGVLTTAENVNKYNADLILQCGQREQLETVANRLFSTLRKFDEANVHVIFAESFSSAGLGTAIMNRLLKAASNQFLKE